MGAARRRRLRRPRGEPAVVAAAPVRARRRWPGTAVGQGRRWLRWHEGAAVGRRRSCVQVCQLPHAPGPLRRLGEFRCVEGRPAGSRPAAPAAARRAAAEATAAQMGPSAAAQDAGRLETPCRRRSTPGGPPMVLAGSVDPRVSSPAARAGGLAGAGGCRRRLATAAAAAGAARRPWRDQGTSHRGGPPCAPPAPPAAPTPPPHRRCRRGAARVRLPAACAGRPGPGESWRQ